MDYRVFGDKIALRLDPGEELLDRISEVCRRQGVRFGSITGIGAANHVTIGFYNLEKQEYSEKDLDYNNDNCRATREQNSASARPAMATVIRNLSQYKTVYLGYPIWWGKEPKLIRTFLDQYSMKGKTVVPFCTSGSSGISGSMAGIRKGAKGAQVLAGEDLTAMSRKEVSAWVSEIGQEQK